MKDSVRIKQARQMSKTFLVSRKSRFKWKPTWNYRNSLFKREFQVVRHEKIQCPIYNGTLETLILTYKQKMLIAEKPQLKINSSNNKKYMFNLYLISQSF